MRRILILLAFFAIANAKKFDYENYKVFRINVTSEEQLKILLSLEESDDAFTFWRWPSKILPTDLMVAPGKLQDFHFMMNATGMRYKLLIENVQDLMTKQYLLGKRTSNFDWTEYHTLEEIHSWLENLERKYPKIVEVIVAGHSYEGRKIKGIKMSFGEDNPGIFIEGGIHAREWISPATVTYLINEFLTSEDPLVRKLAESHDWYIFPSVNPDGYVYTHTTNRMWRKTRSESKNACFGADANRNWDNKWMETGASKDACSETYGGNSAFSEIEMKTLSEYIESIGDKLFAYISFHSYSQLLLFPYGYTDEHLGNYNETYAIGLKTIEALSKRYGTEYTLGTFNEALYPGSGLSIDWVKANLELPIVYLFELRDTGDYGFLLPPDQIIPNSEEIMDALLALFAEARKFGYPKDRK